MRAVQQIASRLRARLRSATGLFPASRRSLPARVTVRVSSGGGPFGFPAPEGATGEVLAEDTYRRLLVETVSWLGPLGVRFVGGTPTRHPRLAAMVRFAHRLDCPVEVVTSGEGLDEPTALDLVDAGLDALWLWVAPDPESGDLGMGRAAAEQAARVFLAAARERGRDVPVGVWVPADVVPDGITAWARRLGLRGCEAVGIWPAAPAGVDRALGRRSCRVASHRLEIRADGSVAACPFAAPLPDAGHGDVAARWRAGEEHFRVIRRCGRGCLHREIVSG